MRDNEPVHTSRCLCGAVQLSLRGRPHVMTYCHCDSCRRWLGAPVHAGCLWKASDVRIERGADRITTFKLTEETGSHRKFCTTCGSPVLCDHPPIGMMDIPAVSIVDFDFEPKLHSHYAEKVLPIRDGLPKYRDFDPEWGGSDETLPE